MSNTHVPERSCVICRSKKEKHNLFRLAKMQENTYEFDKEQKKQARSAYVCKSLNCLGKLVFGMNLIFENIEHIHFVVIAQDISKKNEVKLLKKVNELQIPHKSLATMQDLGNIFNKEEITAIGIKDKKMARGLID